MTGASLQKSLTGQFNIASTNLNLQLVNVRSSALKTIVNVIASVPSLLRNPAETVGNLLGRLAGGTAGGSSDGWVDELTKSPIDVITARGLAGNGRIELQQAFVQSLAFQADAQGTVTLNPVLTNSALQVPVQIALRRPLADKVGLVPANTPTNVAYVKLPDFVALKGTVGDAKADIKKGALVGIAGQAILTTVPGVSGSKVGDLIQGGVGFLTGQPPQQSQQPATQQPAAQPSAQPQPGAAQLPVVIQQFLPSAQSSQPATQPQQSQTPQPPAQPQPGPAPTAPPAPKLQSTPTQPPRTSPQPQQPQKSPQATQPQPQPRPLQLQQLGSKPVSQTGTNRLGTPLTNAPAGVTNKPRITLMKAPQKATNAPGTNVLQVNPADSPQSRTPQKQ
jgi:hypothetical protein